MLETNQVRALIVVHVDLNVLSEARRDEAKVRDVDVVGARHDVEVDVLRLAVLVAFEEPASCGDNAHKNDYP